MTYGIQTEIDLKSLPNGFKALIVGSSGGIGSAVVNLLGSSPQCGHIESISRNHRDRFDLTNETSIAELARVLDRDFGEFHLIFDATGTLDIDGVGPEKSLAALNAENLSKSFAVNVIGPALLLKYLSPLLPRKGKSAFATLSARVGSIGDNRLGGWYAYRASKAALNQIVQTASIEIARRHPEAVVLALHPGTVETDLSRPFAKGQYTHSPQKAAHRLLDVIDSATPELSGSFLAYDGTHIPW